MTRSRGQYLAALDALDVEHRPEWLPGNGLTHCNQAAHAGAAALAVDLPVALANDLQTWLRSAAGVAAGWTPCDAKTAAERAEAGFPTLATLHESVHGHIAFVVPAIGGTGLYVWQAGACNFANAPIIHGFGVKNLPSVLYFTHA